MKLVIGQPTEEAVYPKPVMWVETKRALADAWQIVPYLSPVESAVVLMPSVSSASLRFDYGSMLRVDRTQFRLESPMALARSWVRIKTQYEGSSAVTQWAGQIVSQPANVGGKDIGRTGTQFFQALGVEHLLDRAPLLSSFWLGAGDTTVELRIPPCFNAYGSGKTVIGNRSAELFDDSHLLTRDGEKWSALDILRYVVTRYSVPGGLTWTVSGQTEALAGFFPVVEAPRTIWELLKTLLDRRRALSARVSWDGENSANIEVVSVSPIDIQSPGGEFDISANRRVTDLDIETGPLISSATVEVDEMARVGRIVARGASFMVGFSLNYSLADGNLIAGWSGDQETAYKAAGSELAGFADATAEAKGIIADNARSTRSEWASVYQKFKLNPAWEWEFPERILPETYIDWTVSTGTVVTGERNIPASIALPSLDNNAELMPETKQPLADRWRKFGRHCLLFKNVDYGAGAADPDAVDETIPALVFLLGSEVLVGERICQRFYEGSRPGNSAWPSVSVRPDETELAFWVSATPAHLIAGVWGDTTQEDTVSGGLILLDLAPVDNVVVTRVSDGTIYTEVDESVSPIGPTEYWLDEDTGTLTFNTSNNGVSFSINYDWQIPTEKQPVVDWKEMIITAACESNQFVEVVRDVPGGGDEVMLIEVDDAELWWLVPGTVVGVEDDGRTIRVGEDGLITRDDRARLRAIATLASVWYSLPRVVVRVTQQAIGGLPGPGVMIGRVTAPLGRIVSNTIVTSMRLNYESLTSSFETGFAELDFGSSSGSGSSRMAGAGSPALGIGNNKMATKSDVARAVGQIPVRFATTAPGASSGGSDSDSSSQAGGSLYLGFLSAT